MGINYLLKLFFIYFVVSFCFASGALAYPSEIFRYYPSMEKQTIINKIKISKIKKKNKILLKLYVPFQEVSSTKVDNDINKIKFIISHLDEMGIFYQLQIETSKTDKFFLLAYKLIGKY